MRLSRVTIHEHRPLRRGDGPLEVHTDTELLEAGDGANQLPMGAAPSHEINVLPPETLTDVIYSIAKRSHKGLDPLLPFLDYGTWVELRHQIRITKDSFKEEV